MENASIFLTPLSTLSKKLRPRCVLGLTLLFVCLICATAWTQTSPAAKATSHSKSAITTQKADGPSRAETTDWISERIKDSADLVLKTLISQKSSCVAR